MLTNEETIRFVQIYTDYGGRQFYQVSDSEVEDIKFPKSAKYEDMGFFFEADDVIEDSDNAVWEIHHYAIY